MSPRPIACERCLRRSWLIAGLSPRIERALEGAPGRRAGDLLALRDTELPEALPTTRGEGERPEGPSPAAMREVVASADAWACCRDDDAYPAPLRDLGEQAPACLFGRGDHRLLGRLGEDGRVTAVGSRRPSGHARETATLLARQLAAAGLVVVSGMALGIDSCAHEGALSAGGVTVAVLGNGPDLPHPARMRSLYAEIVRTGLILAELPPGVRARRWTFPARNRMMAALGELVIVVEARERSGSLITAEMAGELGRELGAVPGRVRTVAAGGTNQLLRDGAHVIRSGQDALDSLLGIGVTKAGGIAPGPALEPELAEVLGLVEGGAGDLDAVAREGGFAASAAAAALTQLELRGYVAVDGLGRYERTTLAPPTAD
jgi:DNA processing protein